MRERAPASGAQRSVEAAVDLPGQFRGFSPPPPEEPSTLEEPEEPPQD